MENEVKKALNDAHQLYADMKIKNVIVLFNHLLSIKENYLIAKAGDKNPFVIVRYIEAILTIMNPICPHFCQHVWQSSVYPALSRA